MDFTPTDEQRALGDAVRGVLSRHGSPAAETGDSAAPPPLDKALWEALVEVGVPALVWPEEDGGVGAGYTDLAAAATEIGRARVQVPLAESVVAGALLQRTAPDEVRRELLGGLSEGGALPVPAIAEPSRVWSTRPVSVVATRGGSGSSGGGDGGWTLTGTKAPVRWAPAATHLLVTAAVEGDAGRETGVFLVDAADVSAEQVDLDGAPATLLAAGDAADTALAEAVALGGVVLCAEAVGAMDEALRMTTEYLRARTQFGRPLASFQALSHRAADVYAQVELARSCALFAAMVADEQPLDVDAVLRARVAVDGAARPVGQEAIQMHGGIGVTAEYPVGHLTARLTAITRTFGDRRQRIGELATRVGDHAGVSVLG